MQQVDETKPERSVRTRFHNRHIALTFKPYITYCPAKLQAVMSLLVPLLLALSVVLSHSVMLITQQKPQKLCRRFWIQNSCTASAVFLTGLPSQALVKGNAPPQKASRSSGRKCRDIDECEALGQIREQESFQAAQEPFETTPDGVRYRDVRPALWRCPQTANVLSG